MNPDLTLVIETSIGGGSVSLWEADRLLALDAAEGKGSQSEELLARIDDLFKGNGVNIRDVGWVVCSKGPGGYTGLRVGLATAGALARSIRKDLFAYSNVDVLLSFAKPEDSAAAILDAGRDSYLLCTNNKDGVEMSALGSSELVEIALERGITVMIAAVSNFGRLISTIDESITVKNASDDLNSALYRYFKQNPEKGRDLNPVYGRELTMRGD